MKIYKLIRVSYTKAGTYGVLLDNEGNPICCTIEPPWKDNQINVSCIPCGFYHCHRTRRIKSNREVLMLENVFGRTLIQIHVANLPSELKGCIAPVTYWKKFKSEQGGGESTKAFNKLMNSLEGHLSLFIYIQTSISIHKTS